MYSLKVFLKNFCRVYQIQFSKRDGVECKVSYSQNFWRRHEFYSEIYGLHEQMGVVDFSGKESKKCITTSDVKTSQDVNKGRCW